MSLLRASRIKKGARLWPRRPQLWSQLCHVSIVWLLSLCVLLLYCNTNAIVLSPAERNGGIELNQSRGKPWPSRWGWVTRCPSHLLLQLLKHLPQTPKGRSDNKAGVRRSLVLSAPSYSPAWIAPDGRVPCCLQTAPAPLAWKSKKQQLRGK